MVFGSFRIYRVVTAMRFTLLAAVAMVSAGTMPGNASGDGAHIVKAIVFAGQTVDRLHIVKRRDWTIGFGTTRPFATSDTHGMTLHGLRCADAAGKAIDCHLFMAMQLVESRPHHCEITPDDRHAVGHWPQRIDCPSEIDFGQ